MHSVVEIAVTPKIAGQKSQEEITEEVFPFNLCSIEEFIFRH